MYKPFEYSLYTELHDGCKQVYSFLNQPFLQNNIFTPGLEMCHVFDSRLLGNLGLVFPDLIQKRVWRSVVG